jgi:uncharacterized protein YwqG
MKQDEVRNRIIASAPAAGPSIAAHLMPAVRLVTWPIADDRLPLGASKFGGRPDLQRGTPWPAWQNRSGSTRPLRFFAQVDLAAAAQAAPAPLDLPVSGLLSFFADFDQEDDSGISGLFSWEQPGAAVIHSPADVELQRLESPVPTLGSAAFAMVPAWTWPQEPPSEIELADAEFDALDELDRAYESHLQGVAGHWRLDGRHQLAGHARHIQHPVEEEVVQARAGCFDSGDFDRARWEAAKSQVPDWRLILQIDSDDGLDVMWGDVGTLYWAARRDDARADRWDDAAFNFQCS